MTQKTPTRTRTNITISNHKHQVSRTNQKQQLIVIREESNIESVSSSKQTHPTGRMRKPSRLPTKNALEEKWELTAYTRCGKVSGYNP